MIDIGQLCKGCMRKIKNPGGICPICKYDNSKEEKRSSKCLPMNEILNGRYLLGRILGEGGFGITYLAMDLVKEEPVAIKEYFPVGLASRDMTAGRETLLIMPGEKGFHYRNGLERFTKEGQILARFEQLPGIVTARDFFFANQTAYLVMDYVEGQSLKQYMQWYQKNNKNGVPMDYQVAIAFLRPVMDSLMEIHKVGLLHRDISPDNIIVGTDGKVTLVDFGAARENIVGKEYRTMTVMVKHGYAPEEQYRSHGEQGAWTDIYALCATLYHMISGILPVDAVERLYQDGLVPLKQLKLKTPVPEGVSDVIAKGMAVRGRERYQTMEELSCVLWREVEKQERLESEQKERQLRARKERQEQEARAAQQKTEQEKCHEEEKRRKEELREEEEKERQRKLADQRYQEKEKREKESQQQKEYLEKVQQAKRRKKAGLCVFVVFVMLSLIAGVIIEKHIQSESRRAAEESERLAAESEAKEKSERLAAESKAKEESERLAAESEAKEESERLAAESEAKAESERLAAEERAKKESEKLLAESERLVAESERLAAVFEKFKGSYVSASNEKVSFADFSMHNGKALLRLREKFQIAAEEYRVLLFAESEFQDQNVWICVYDNQYDAAELTEKYKEGNGNIYIEGAPSVEDAALKLFEESNEEWDDCFGLLKSRMGGSKTAYKVTISEKKIEGESGDSLKDQKFYILMEQDECILPLDLAKELYGFVVDIEENMITIHCADGLFSKSPVLFVSWGQEVRGVTLEKSGIETRMVIYRKK